MKITGKTLFLLIVVLVCVLAASIGVTAAIWTGEGGESSYAPQATVSDWNAWAKYFDYETYGEESDGEIIITGFKSTGGMTNEDIVIPRSIENKKVAAIANTLFSEASLKTFPVTITVSPTVMVIEDNAFSGLTNLRKVIFGSNADANSSASETELADKASVCTVGRFAFSGCTSLLGVELKGWRKAYFSDYAFSGCRNLSAIDTNGDNASYELSEKALSGSPLG